MEKYLLAGKNLFNVCLVRRKKNDYIAQDVHMSTVEDYILFLVTFCNFS